MFTTEFSFLPLLRNLLKADAKMVSWSTFMHNFFWVTDSNLGRDGWGNWPFGKSGTKSICSKQCSMFLALCCGGCCFYYLLSKSHSLGGIVSRKTCKKSDIVSMTIRLLLKQNQFEIKCLLACGGGSTLTTTKLLTANRPYSSWYLYIAM